MWSRRQTTIGGIPHDNDWLVYRHKQSVGRVLMSVQVPDVPAYSWNTLTNPAMNGRAETLEEALSELREAIRSRWPDDLPEVPRHGTKFFDLP